MLETIDASGEFSERVVIHEIVCKLVKRIVINTTIMEEKPSLKNAHELQRPRKIQN